MPRALLRQKRIQILYRLRKVRLETRPQIRIRRVCKASVQSDAVDVRDMRHAVRENEGDEPEETADGTGVDVVAAEGGGGDDGAGDEVVGDDSRADVAVDCFHDVSS